MPALLLAKGPSLEYLSPGLSTAPHSLLLREGEVNCLTGKLKSSPSQEVCASQPIYHSAVFFRTGSPGERPEVVQL